MTRIRIALVTLAASMLWSQYAAAQLYERPVLVVDPGVHTAVAKTAAADAAGRFIVTGSYDKTVRLWSAADGSLLQTIRVPAGPGRRGQIFAVAMSPDGELISAGGFGEGHGIFPLYLFERATGKMKKRIPGLPETVHGLAFSADGRYLAAICHSRGLRVFDRDRDWAEIFSDADYGEEGYGVAFAADGRLATSSYDGIVRLYGRGPDSAFTLVKTQNEISGRLPFRLAFSPNGSVLAVGYNDKPAVDFFDGRSLARLPPPDLGGLSGGNLMQVAWSADGRTLFAGGGYRDAGGLRPVLAWDDGGRGPRRSLSAQCAATDNRTTALLALSHARLLALKFNPCLSMLNADGGVQWSVGPAGGDFRDERVAFATSADGSIIDFGFEEAGQSPVRFDVNALRLSDRPSTDPPTRPPRQEGLAVVHWQDSSSPRLDGKPLALENLERSRSLAIDADGHRFVLGAEWHVYAFDASGKKLWTSAAPDVAWAVNISGDGHLAVVAYGDGTIRWLRMEDGREILALYVLRDKKNWVLWKPEGFYEATPGALGVLKWHVNRGNEAVAETLPVSAIPKLHRPDALPLVLQQLETARALGIADLKAARIEVQTVTHSPVAPGAQLHVLAIGVSDYGDKAKSFHLNFAATDAKDIADVLYSSQASEAGGFYARVNPNILVDERADAGSINDAFVALEGAMAKGGGQDVAVVFFSGHGAMIHGQFYLVPNGVDARTPGRLESTAISADQLHHNITAVAAHGRVLMLLDACHSGGATGNGAELTPDADSLRNAISAGRVTILTSSRGKEPSLEDPSDKAKWRFGGHGAFTKVLLDALHGAADHDGQNYV